MVHEGFTPLLTGRTVLVRIDDLTPAERADVSEFFHLVQRIRKLDELPAGATVITGGTLFFPMFVMALIVNRLMSVIAAIGCITIGCAIAYVITNGYARERTPAVYEKLLVIMRRSERCRIAAEEIRQAHTSYAELLPPIPVPVSPTAG